MHGCNKITVIKVVTFRCSKCEPSVSPVVGSSYQNMFLMNVFFPKQAGRIIWVLMTNHHLMSLSCRGKLKAIKNEARGRPI